jgi:hypothetical protein
MPRLSVLAPTPSPLIPSLLCPARAAEKQAEGEPASSSPSPAGSDGPAAAAAAAAAGEDQDAADEDEDDEDEGVRAMENALALVARAKQLLGQAEGVVRGGRARRRAAAQAGGRARGRVGGLRGRAGSGMTLGVQ